MAASWRHTALVNIVITVTLLFCFPNIKPITTTLPAHGKWRQQNKIAITLSKTNEFDSYDSASFNTVELIQPYSMKNEYFKLLISKEQREQMLIIGVRVYEKKTYKLLQELSLDNCQFWGLENIYVEDYNFDGIDDFSVFEASYAGPNTSRIYILRDKKTDTFFISEISGVSLEFDQEAKRIYEHNQCCAGRSHMNATYELVDNKMVLIEQRCIEYDDETEYFIETDCD